MSCHTSGHDTQLILKLFKTACLSYRSSDVKYRGHNISRNALVSLRRDLVEKVTESLSDSSLFKEGLVYPRRYFDDLITEQRHVELHT